MLTASGGDAVGSKLYNLSSLETRRKGEPQSDQALSSSQKVELEKHISTEDYINDILKKETKEIEGSVLY